ncbi:MAG: POTRA domain-containing protein [Rikenellaceae bacterium]
MENRFRIVLCFLALMWFTASLGFAQNDADSVKVVLPSLDYTNPKKYVIEDIKVTGIKYLSPELIIGTTGMAKGDTIYLPSDYITNILNQLWSQRYYSNVRALVETQGDKAFIEIVLKERPRVSAWQFEGVKPSEAKEIKERLKLKERVELSDFALKNSEEIIHRYLNEKGFRNGTINIKQKNDTLLDNFVVVTFDIKKGPKVKIGEIIIDGNVALAEKKLKKSMKKTRQKSLMNMFKSAKLNDKDFKEDKVLLEDYMRSLGYRDGVVLSDSVYQISENRIGINLKIEEGKKYYYRNINWVGNVKHSKEVLNQLLAIQKGDVYDKKSMDSRLGIGAEGSKAAM